MKDFFKYMFATVAGILVFTIIAGILGTMCIIGMVASENSAKNVSDNTVLVLNLDGQLGERSEDDITSVLSGGGSEASGLDDILDAIEKAEENDKIKGIYIEAGMFAPDSYASLQAIRRALVNFKKSGKWIIAYGDTYTQATYYIASAADKVYLNPSGTIEWKGMVSQPMFLKDLLAKFGVKVQLAKVGTYKSAPEMLTADKMSDANREQVSVYINGLWQNICKGVSESRGISIENLNIYADNLVMFNAAEDFVKYKFADKLIYTDEIKTIINKLLKRDKDNGINTVSVAEMKTIKGKKHEGEKIAVYYAYGNIVDNDTQGLLSKGHQIIGTEVCKDLESLMNDDDVKAVVLRINSGGGSAYASEQIWHYVEMLKAKKPVVVSMGGMAASGGYYISSGANWIVAEPATLTGSIGIFGMFPDASELLTQKLGIKFDEVKTNRNSGFGTPARPFNEEEMSYLSKYIDRGYKLFRSRVAKGRNMSTDAVENIAQGRVWLGQDALKIKLVDELGGIDKAVAKAASLAKLKKYRTSAYPEKTSWMDKLSNSVSKKSYINNSIKSALGEYYEPFMLLETMNKQNAIQARIPFVINVR